MFFYILIGICLSSQISTDTRNLFKALHNINDISPKHYSNQEVLSTVITSEISPFDKEWDIYKSIWKSTDCDLFQEDVNSHGKYIKKYLSGRPLPIRGNLVKYLILTMTMLYKNNYKFLQFSKCLKSIAPLIYTVLTRIFLPESRSWANREEWMSQGIIGMNNNNANVNLYDEYNSLFNSFEHFSLFLTMANQQNKEKSDPPSWSIVMSNVLNELMTSHIDYGTPIYYSPEEYINTFGEKDESAPEKFKKKSNKFVKNNYIPKKCFINFKKKNVQIFSIIYKSSFINHLFESHPLSKFNSQLQLSIENSLLFKSLFIPILSKWWFFSKLAKNYSHEKIVHNDDYFLNSKNFKSKFAEKMAESSKLYSKGHNEDLYIPPNISEKCLQYFQNLNTEKIDGVLDFEGKTDDEIAVISFNFIMEFRLCLSEYDDNSVEHFNIEKIDDFFKSFWRFRNMFNYGLSKIHNFIKIHWKGKEAFLFKHYLVSIIIPIYSVHESIPHEMRNTFIKSNDFIYISVDLIYDSVMNSHLQSADRKGNLTLHGAVGSLYHNFILHLTLSEDRRSSLSILKENIMLDIEKVFHTIYVSRFNTNVQHFIINIYLSGILGLKKALVDFYFGIMLTKGPDSIIKKLQNGYIEGIKFEITKIFPLIFQNLDEGSGRYYRSIETPISRQLLQVLWNNEFSTLIYPWLSKNVTPELRGRWREHLDGDERWKIMTRSSDIYSPLSILNGDLHDVQYSRHLNQDFENIQYIRELTFEVDVGYIADSVSVNNVDLKKFLFSCHYYLSQTEDLMSPGNKQFNLIYQYNMEDDNLSDVFHSAIIGQISNSIWSMSHLLDRFIPMINILLSNVNFKTYQSYIDEMANYFLNEYFPKIIVAFDGVGGSPLTDPQKTPLLYAVGEFFSYFDFDVDVDLNNPHYFNAIVDLLTDGEILGYSKTGILLRQYRSSAKEENDLTGILLEEEKDDLGLENRDEFHRLNAKESSSLKRMLVSSDSSDIQSEVSSVKSELTNIIYNSPCMYLNKSRNYMIVKCRAWWELIISVSKKCSRNLFIYDETVHEQILYSYIPDLYFIPGGLVMTMSPTVVSLGKNQPPQNPPDSSSEESSTNPPIDVIRLKSALNDFYKFLTESQTEAINIDEINKLEIDEKVILPKHQIKTPIDQLPDFSQGEDIDEFFKKVDNLKFSSPTLFWRIIDSFFYDGVNSINLNEVNDKLPDECVSNVNFFYAENIGEEFHLSFSVNYHGNFEVFLRFLMKFSNESVEVKFALERVIKPLLYCFGSRYIVRSIDYYPPE